MDKRFEVVACWSPKGEPVRYMVLVNGFQWGGNVDASGSGDATFESVEAASQAFISARVQS